MSNEYVEAAAMQVTRDGEWLPADELQTSLIAAVGEDGAVEVDFGDVEHIDARPLQLLLAFVLERTGAGKTVRLLHVSAGLTRWFEYVGAAPVLEPLRVDIAV